MVLVVTDEKQLQGESLLCLKTAQLFLGGANSGGVERPLEHLCELGGLRHYCNI